MKRDLFLNIAAMSHFFFAAMTAQFTANSNECHTSERADRASRLREEKLSNAGLLLT